VGYRSQGPFGRDGIEGWQSRERRSKSVQMARHAAAAEVLVHRRLVVLQRIPEQEAALHDEVIEPASPRLEQLDDGEEPRVAVAEIGVVPQPGLLQQRTEPPSELLGREPR